jgi:hypothetical protein
MRPWNASFGNGLLRTSAKFVVSGMWTKFIMPPAMASRTLWYPHAWCFFLRIEEGTEVLLQHHAIVVSK